MVICSKLVFPRDHGAFSNCLQVQQHKSSCITLYSILSLEMMSVFLLSAGELSVTCKILFVYTAFSFTWLHGQKTVIWVRVLIIAVSRQQYLRRIFSCCSAASTVPLQDGKTHIHNVCFSNIIGYGYMDNVTTIWLKSFGLEIAAQLLSCLFKCSVHLEYKILTCKLV